jgi:hypothetical protein
MNMIKRITSKKSDLSRERLDKDWHRNLEFMDNISAFPEDWYLKEKQQQQQQHPHSSRSRSNDTDRSNKHRSKSNNDNTNKDNSKKTNKSADYEDDFD